MISIGLMKLGLMVNRVGRSIIENRSKQTINSPLVIRYPYCYQLSILEMLGAMFGLFRKKRVEERRYDVSYVQSELVVLAARLISKQTDMFSHIVDNSNDRDKNGQLLSPRYITPWVIGYCIGLLDAVTQTQANRMKFTAEMQSLLFSVMFGESKVPNANAVYIACNEASDPDHVFHVTFEIYLSGLEKAFNEICEEKPVIGLFTYLQS